MVGFVKLQSSILQSTVWREPNHVRILWITMLALADKKGIVEGSIPGLADSARITIEECEEALGKLMSPDKYSRTKDFDGKRVGQIEGGWLVLNYEKYRAPTSAERTAKWREKRNVTSQNVTQSHKASQVSLSASVKDPEADPEAEISLRAPAPTRDNKQKRSSRKQKHICPDDWQPNDKHKALARSLGVDCNDQAERMRDKSRGDPWLKSDWNRTFNNWLRQAADYRGNKPVQSSLPDGGYKDLTK